MNNNDYIEKADLWLNVEGVDVTNGFMKKNMNDGIKNFLMIEWM